MKTKFLLLATLVLGLGSCTTAYKTGQTPDDVYYSPTRTIGSDEAREDERREDDRYYANEDQGDRYLRYRVRDRRWNALDDDYWRYGYNNYGFNYTPYNNPYYFGNGFGYGRPWNNYNYNPYCPFPVPGNPVFGNGYGYTPPKVFRPRTGGLGGYNGGDYNNGNGNGGKPGTVQRPVRLYGNRNYNNSNNGNGLGESIRKIFSGSGNSNNNSNSNGNNRPVRSYEPSPSNNNGGGNNNSGGSGGGSGGGGGISRPARSGGR